MPARGNKGCMQEATSTASGSHLSLVCLLYKSQQARLRRKHKTQTDAHTSTCVFRFHSVCPQPRQYANTPSLMLSHLSQNTSKASKVPSIPCVKTLVQGRGPTESSVQVKQVKQVTSGMGSEATAGRTARSPLLVTCFTCFTCLAWRRLRAVLCPQPPRSLLYSPRLQAESN